MTHSMEEKIRTIDGYIEHLEDSISTGDSKKAENLQTEIIAVFEPEIDGLKVNLDNYNVSHLYLNNPVDYIGDAKLLKAKLQNYKLNLASGLYKPFQGADGAGTVTVTQHVNQDVCTEVVITLDQVISNIQDLPETELSAEDKDMKPAEIL